MSTFRSDPRHRSSIALLAGLCLALGMSLLGCGQQPAADTIYYCPMHPTYTSDRPGTCPICNMQLVPQQSATPKATAGQDSTAVDGMAVVSLDEQGRSLAGIQTAVATRQTIGRTIRTVGNVIPDETRIRRENTRIEGYVEKLYVNSPGQFVQAGDPMLTIYSPELLARQEEFLQARAAALRFQKSELPEVRRGGEKLLESMRQRLQRFQVPESFVVELERTGIAQRTVTLVAQASGHVTENNVREGQYVEAGSVLYTVTDLSRVWVEADFYEAETRLVQLGQSALVTLPYDAASSLQGKVAYIYPYLDAETRTLRVRLELANAKLQLKPSMYVDVALQINATSAIIVPESAVMDSGLRRIVFVEVDANRFEPREVQLGIRDGANVEILAGLAAGEIVVVKANFLLDSESRLRGAVEGSSKSDHAHGETP